MKNPSGNLPLDGIRVLVTRAWSQSADMVSRLESKGARVRVVPAVHMEPEADPAGIRQALSDPGGADHLLFTSVNGVEFFLKFLENERAGSGAHIGDLPPAMCVGSKTALAWERAGGKVSLVPERYTAQGLLEMLPSDLSGQRFLLFRPREVTTPLGELIEARGGIVREVILYRTVVPEEGAAALKTALAEGLDVVTFASPSAVKGTVELLGKVEGEKWKKILDLPALCIGPTTAEAAREAGFTNIHFPAEHTGGGMVEMLTRLLGSS
ncbi:MAG: uroporphyrinogen-III synthase [bacterium]|nr:uroporphyrinogen-III synthase [bacterium]